mmetsp:Transcript_19140/g.47850  ORF Transcript_19140/g.47850 Transcript_19140/m.47850 type:complete len:256 (-) Transcript_19140:480-1247(-)
MGGIKILHEFTDVLIPILVVFRGLRAVSCVGPEGVDSSFATDTRDRQRPGEGGEIRVARIGCCGHVLKKLKRRSDLIIREISIARERQPLPGECVARALAFCGVWCQRRVGLAKKGAESEPATPPCLAVGGDLSNRLTEPIPVVRKMGAIAVEVLERGKLLLAPLRHFFFIFIPVLRAICSSRCSAVLLRRRPASQREERVERPQILTRVPGPLEGPLPSLVQKAALRVLIDHVRRLAWLRNVVVDGRIEVVHIR